MRPIRILQVITAFGTGGTERGIVNIVNRLPRNEFESELCIFGWEGADETIAKIHDPDFKVHCLEKRYGNDPRVALRLARLLRHGKFDMVHSRGWPTVLEMAAARLLAPGMPALHSEHGTSFLEAGRRRTAYSLLSPRWGKFLFVSRALRDQFRAGTRIDPDKMVVIPNGVDFGRFDGRSPEPELRSRFPADWFHVGTVGRFHEVKNHAMLLETARLAKERNLRWRFHFAGDGGLRARYEEFVAKHELADHVAFHGNLGSVERFYPLLDLFALTSVSEGHPNALLEALASGVASVSTPVGDVPHFIRDGENGLIVPQGDPAALFAIVERAAADKSALGRIARRGHDDAKAIFDLDVMIDSYASLYREMTGRPATADAG